ncbi:MAG TPA: ECF-type sigma factor [Longimicrobiales bacterium]
MTPIPHLPAPSARARPSRQPPPDDGESLAGLVPFVYRELRAIARRHLGAPGGARRRGGTLSATALVNEAYLKLAAAPERTWRDRPHFLAVAALAMRQILVDRARARAALKRGGGLSRVTLDEDALASDDQPEALLALDQALERLASLAPRLARVVELRFYGGLAEEEIAAALGVTTRTVQRDWAKARMLLRRALDEG